MWRHYKFPVCECSCICWCRLQVNHCPNATFHLALPHSIQDLSQLQIVTSLIVNIRVHLSHSLMVTYHSFHLDMSFFSGACTCWIFFLPIFWVTDCQNIDRKNISTNYKPRWRSSYLIERRIIDNNQLIERRWRKIFQKYKSQEDFIVFTI